jgi:hypothetical protein
MFYYQEWGSARLASVVEQGGNPPEQQLCVIPCLVSGRFLLCCVVWWGCFVRRAIVP